MFRNFHEKKGQSTLEYGLVIAVIVGALIAMQMYFKRGLQGRYRQSTDDIGDQFSPELTTGIRTTNSTVVSTEEVLGGPQPTSKTESQQEQNRFANETTPVLSEEKM